MEWDFLKAETTAKYAAENTPAATPRLPGSTRAVTAMAAIGVLTGLISSIPSPLPEVRLDEDGLLLNAEAVPLHAGIAFAAGIAFTLWLWVKRDLGKCLLAMALILVGWLAAVNTANDLYQALVGSDLFGTAVGAKANREALGLLLGGATGGAVGAGLTAFGSGIPAEAIRRPRNWVTIVLVGSAVGLLLYPAADLNLLPIVLVPWQALVAASIGYVLTRPQ